MASDVSHPAKNLPLRWKARLSDQPPTVRADPQPRNRRAVEDRTSPASVVIEPTTPVTEMGLPAFKIRQEIEPQPTSALSGAPEPERDLRTGIIVAVACAAIVALVVVGFIILS